MESSKPIIPTPGFLMIFFIIIMLSFIRTCTSLTPNYVGDDCHIKTPQALADSYKANLNQLLSWLSTDSATSKGYNHATIGNSTNSTVYGLYDCRGDDPGYLCQFCVSTATRELLQRCPNQPSAAIWYSYCILRYSNENFLGKVTMSPLWSMEGANKKVSDPMEWKKVESYIRSLIGQATEETKELSAWGEFDLGGGRRRYALVQCSRDLDRKSCKQCLEAMMNNITRCCEEKQGWQLGTPSCMIKYNDYMFYQPPSPDHNPTAAKSLIISISLLVAVAILSFSIYLWRRMKTRRDEPPLEGAPIFYDFSRRERSLNAELPTIPLHVIQQSTHHFSEDSKLGEGGFGTVYKLVAKLTETKKLSFNPSMKMTLFYDVVNEEDLIEGTLPDGKEIAVKRLSLASSQGSKEFKNEVIFIAKLQHRNLVKLLGCCIEKNEKLLVYEYMPNSSLDFHLFNDENRKKLHWNQRLNIINGIAKGLLYLHEDSRLRVVHRDLKASNVLLDNEMNPKISDFGLARTFEGARDEGNTKRIMGTYGYMAPEYAMEGSFSVKSDVFSFGVLLLEIICGKKICSFYLSEHGQSLLIYTWNLWCKGKSLELLDPMLKDSYIANEVVKCIHIGLLCVQEDPDDRPTMSTIVVMLASDTMTLPTPDPPAFSRRKSMEDQSTTSKTFNDASVNEITVSHITPR